MTSATPTATREPVRHEVKGADDAPLVLWHYGGGGGGQGMPLLFGHAAGLSARLSENLLLGLTEVCDIWALDLRGHGASGGGGSISPHALQRDFVAAGRHFAAARGGGKPVLFGHSLSGAVGLTQSSEGPFGALICFDAAVFPASDSESFEEATELLEKRLATTQRRTRSWQDLPEFEAYLASRRPFRDWTSASRDLAARTLVRPSDAGGLELACTPENEWRAFELLPALGDLARKHPTDLPTLLLGADPESPAATWASRGQRQLVELLPSARYTPLKELGHLAPIDAPAPIEREIKRALASGGFLGQRR